MAKLEIDLSGRGGLAPRFWGDIDRTTSEPQFRLHRTSTKPGQMADGIWNPFRIYGYMSPANATTADVTAASGAYGSIMSSSLYDLENDDFYFAERGQQLWRGDTLDDTTMTLALDLGSSGSPTIYDLEVYQVNGARKMFVVYETGGNMEIAISDLPYDTGTDNLTWLSGTVSGAFTQAITGDAFMEVADNGFAYLFYDNKVSKIDGTTNGGTNGTISANVLLFPAYFRCVDAVDYRGLMFIAIHQFSTETRATFAATSANTMRLGVYIWDRQSSVVNTRDFIPIQGCKEIRKVYVAPNGQLRVFAINSENVGVILEYNGSSFQPLVETGILGVPRYRDSLTTVGGCTIWLAQARSTSDNANVGTIFAHGKITPFDSEALYKIGRIANWTSPGAIIFGGANADSATDTFKTHKTGLYLGCAVGGASKILEWDMYGTGADGQTCTSVQGGIWTPIHTLPAMSVINYIDIYTQFNTYSVDATLATLTIYLGGNPTAWASKSITFANTRLGHIRIDVQKPYVNSVQLLIDFAAAIDPAGFGFAPYLAVVDYTPSEDKG